MEKFIVINENLGVSENLHYTLAHRGFTLAGGGFAGDRENAKQYYTYGRHGILNVDTLDNAIDVINRIKHVESYRIVSGYFSTTEPEGYYVDLVCGGDRGYLVIMDQR